MRKINTLLLALLLSTGALAQYPKIANYYLDGDVGLEAAAELARYDLLVLDMELQGRELQLFEDIRELNPEIKILAYMTCQEINPDVDDWEPLRLQLLESIEDDWWLRDTDGSHVVFWPGTWMLNVSDSCPEVNGETWVDHFAAFVRDEILFSGVWDGFYVDNCWFTASWLSDNLDLNLDGSAEDELEVDRAWRAGMNDLLEQLRDNDPSFIFMGNTGYVYQDHLNGVLIENFPELYGWVSLMQIYNSFEISAQFPFYNIINCSPPAGNQDDYQRMRFGLTSTLLNNGYYCFDFGADDHSQFWWYDEYDTDLGLPLGDANCLNNSNIIEEGFENGDGGFILNNWDQMHTQIIQESIEGTWAVQCNTLNSGDEWHEFLETPENIEFQAGSEIHIKFQCSIDSLYPDTRFYCMARSEAGGENNDCEFYFQREFDLQQITSIDTTLILAEYNDYRIIWGIQNSGLISIDNIQIYDDSNLMYSRQFQNGLILCNPSTQTQTFQLGSEYQRLNGTQNPDFNNGQVVTEVTLQPQDGIILRVLSDIKRPESAEIPSEYKLYNAYPNPFNSTTTVSFDIPEPQHVSLKLFDLLGKEVQSIEKDFFQAGHHTRKIEAENLATGVYYLQFETRNYQSVKKIVLIK